MSKDPRWFVLLEAFFLASPWPGLPDRRPRRGVTRREAARGWGSRVSVVALALATAVASALSAS
jgi:hypothetical protein